MQDLSFSTVTFHLVVSTLPFDYVKFGQNFQTRKDRAFKFHFDCSKTFHSEQNYLAWTSTVLLMAAI